MSRTLRRLRSATGDPLLVRAGRGLVPRPYAAELRERVLALSRDVLAVLRPHVSQLDIASLERTFTIRANEGFVAALSASLVAAITKAAPRVRLRFAPKPEKDARPLREGQIDLEIGVLGAFAPEVRRQSLFRDRFVGVVGLGIRFFRAQTLRPKDMQLAIMLLRQGKGNSPDQLTTPWKDLGPNGGPPL
jgi:DNA-binding transcriptional LysR family regulator